MVGQVELHKSRVGVCWRVGLRRTAAVVHLNSKQIVFLLIEGVETGGETVWTRFNMSIALASHIV